MKLAKEVGAAKVEATSPAATPKEAAKTKGRKK